MLGSSSTTKIRSLTAIFLPLFLFPFASSGPSATRTQTCYPDAVRFPPKSSRGAPGPAVLRWPVLTPCRMCCDPRGQSLRKSLGDARERSRPRNQLRSLPRYWAAEVGIFSALPLAQLRQCDVPKSGAWPATSRCPRQRYASRHYRGDWQQPVALFDSQTGTSGSKDPAAFPALRLSFGTPRLATSPLRPGSLADRFPLTAIPVFRFPVPSNSKTWRRAAPVSRSFLWTPPECLFVSPSVFRASRREEDRNILL